MITPGAGRSIACASTTPSIAVACRAIFSFQRLGFLELQDGWLRPPPIPKKEISCYNHHQRCSTTPLAAR
ncbi:hypothetical protein PIB30_093096 [Stylosanthes scabra]|uniref:Uncharacterized protein n=1 Tax=Stylosanthes scabra TaxID=79078 RepID=A0ABU6XU59_9FABA|nr:hypothetical protein [Stylosanthes scabra]